MGHNTTKKLGVETASIGLSDLLNDIDFASLVKPTSDFEQDSSIIDVDDEDDSISYEPVGVMCNGYSMLRNRNDDERYVIRKNSIKSKHIKIEDLIAVYTIGHFIVMQLHNMAMYFDTYNGKLSRKKW